MLIFESKKGLEWILSPFGRGNYAYKAKKAF